MEQNSVTMTTGPAYKPPASTYMQSRHKLLFELQTRRNKFTKQPSPLLELKLLKESVFVYGVCIKSTSTNSGVLGFLFDNMPCA